ncbi:MAG: hypothetical protein ACJAZY_002647 [Spirosomataceae bacterium]|jgi:hypothetical protein
MKKLCILLICLTPISAVSFAQSGLGIKGGLNLTSISTDAGSLRDNIMESYENRTGYAFGLWGRLGDKFFIQPELMVASKGGELNVVPVGGGSPQTVKIKYTDLDVPVLIGFKPLKFLRVMGGPVASFKLTEDDQLREVLKDYANDPDQAFADATYGYQVGVGIKVLGIELDVRHQGSLGDISALNLANEPKFSQRTQGWQITAAFKLL